MLGLVTDKLNKKNKKRQTKKKQKKSCMVFICYWCTALSVIDKRNIPQNNEGEAKNGRWLVRVPLNTRRARKGHHNAPS